MRVGLVGEGGRCVDGIDCPNDGLGDYRSVGHVTREEKEQQLFYSESILCSTHEFFLNGTSLLTMMTLEYGRDEGGKPGETCRLLGNSEVLVSSHPSNGLNVEILNVGGCLSDGNLMLRSMASFLLWENTALFWPGPGRYPTSFEGP